MARDLIGGTGTSAEGAHEFRSRLDEVHEAARREPLGQPKPKEVVIGLFAESDPARASTFVEQLRLVAEREIENVVASIPLVEENSRLSWEPSMDCVADATHINWKINQVGRVLSDEQDGYLSSIQFDWTDSRTSPTNPFSL